MIGAWKSFDDLEESITLDELFEIYETILEQEAETFRRDASLQGVQLPEVPDRAEEEYEESFKERLARKKAEETGDDTELNRIRFGQGQGHVVIGG